MRATQIIAAATLTLAIAGCGSSSPSARRLSAAGAAKLHAEVASVRGAAAADNQTRALAALDQFSRSVSQAAHASQISSGELAVLTRDIAQTRRQILAEVRPPVTTPAPAPPATPAPAPPAKSHTGHEGHGHDHGGGGGNGGGDGGD